MTGHSPEADLSIAALVRRRLMLVRREAVARCGGNLITYKKRKPTFRAGQYRNFFSVTA